MAKNKIAFLKAPRTTTKRERKHPYVTTKKPEERFVCVKCDQPTENDESMHCFECRIAWEQLHRAF